MSEQSDLNIRLEAVAAATEAAIMRRLDNLPAAPKRLVDAMRYAATGGKRIRPFLLVEAAALFGVAEADALPVGAAFECVHCYSLVHDDLPAMDDDNLRRGRPTAHIAFDEATAILAGDSLLTLAFEMLAGLKADAEIRVALIDSLAKASGIAGMAGGQMRDLEAEGRFAGGQPFTLTVPDIERLQAMKTGALLSAACESGAILGGARQQERAALAVYAGTIGLAFQIADDLLDAEGDAASIGKAAAKDAKKGKATLVSALGIDASRKRLAALVAKAEAALAPFGKRADMLKACARYIAERKN